LIVAATASDINKWHGRNHIPLCVSMDSVALTWGPDDGGPYRSQRQHLPSVNFLALFESILVTALANWQIAKTGDLALLLPLC
jgi:hypothetical protein